MIICNRPRAKFAARRSCRPRASELQMDCARRPARFASSLAEVRRRRRVPFFPMTQLVFVWQRALPTSLQSSLALRCWRAIRDLRQPPPSVRLERNRRPPPAACFCRRQRRPLLGIVALEPLRQRLAPDDEWPPHNGPKVSYKTSQPTVAGVVISVAAAAAALIVVT